MYTNNGNQYRGPQMKIIKAKASGVMVIALDWVAAMYQISITYHADAEPLASKLLLKHPATLGRSQPCALLSADRLSS